MQKSCKESSGPGKPDSRQNPPKTAPKSRLLRRANASAPSLDSALGSGGLFLAYQSNWITQRLEGRAILRVWEKANRIGATWADSFASVASRIEPGASDYLFMSQNYAGALEYMKSVREFLSLFDLARFAAIGELELFVPDAKAAAPDAGFAERIKVGSIAFEGGARILCFSSNPWALQTFDGDVGWDEADFHEHQEDAYTAVQSRTAWGHTAGMWSALTNRRSFFKDVIAKTARLEAGQAGSPWSFQRTTIHDAITAGLVERINAKAGTTWTRAEFLANCKKRALTPAIFAARYELNPVDDGSALVEWRVIESCRDDLSIRRAHFDDEAVSERFGSVAEENRATRRRAIWQEMERRFDSLAQRPAHYRLGFDVAASGSGHLGAIFIADAVCGVLRLRGLLTMQTQDWHFMESALSWFLKHLPAVRGAGDETGLGRQICWNAARDFPHQFSPVNFSREKSALGVRLMHALTEGAFRLPRVHDDIAHDFYALQKATTAKGAVTFSEGANPLNPLSHCDIAWAGALALHAEASHTAAPVTLTLI